MLVEDLLKNNYLITPSAYYLLVEHYKKEFTLAELIKFAKSRGTFVVDSALAEEFLRSIGLVSGGAPQETAPIRAEENETLEAYIGQNSTLETSSSEKSSEVSEKPEISPVVPESVSEESAPGETSVSTGTPPEEKPYEVSTVGEKGLEPTNVGGLSSISTGIPLEERASENLSDGKEELTGEISEGRSFVSTGSSGEGNELQSDSGAVSEVVDVALEGALPLENGNGYGLTSDSEEYYENGEVKPKIVYGDYGVPVAYVAEDVEGEKSYSVYDGLVISPKEGFVYRAKEIPDDYRVVFDVKNVKFEAPKVKNASSKEGEVIIQAYSNYFRSRLRKMKRILRENPEVGSVVDIAKLSYIRDEEVTIVGLVSDKRETSKGFIFVLEDATGMTKVFVNKNNGEAEKLKSVMPDSVIAVRGRPGNGIFFASKVFLPDVPKFRKKKPPLEEKVYAILLSDIHVGSNKFCERAFEKFLEWLNGEVNSRTEEELVSRVKYLILGGDVVDGVGIYPGQYNELAIPDIFDQYEALANLLKNVPDHITIFIGPGNHDAARTALPQPGFYEEYARPLFKLKNAVIISNPAVIRLHGRDFLIAHGRGIEDVVDFVPGRSHHQPAEAMLELLKLRHLAPTFGNKVPIAPDPEDTLVIEQVPDLFQAGHVHVLQYLTYNGVFVINTGTWQAQTEFQKMVNIVPTPARVPIIDVETARLRAIVHFDQFCEGV
ncbi:DNA-directed DNA polymerase II small subunit [Thermococcus sp.]|uniref:DNA-directed DNA polymerase II small subunit n=1 Tax=Thermococcus sp. TaxID=35749 RepID=UPI0026383208|nr:DNA-directed DNA polymerase II small subunit [Thermococcus sp.]